MKKNGFYSRLREVEQHVRHDVPELPLLCTKFYPQGTPEATIRKELDASYASGAIVRNYTHIRL